MQTIFRRMINSGKNKEGNYILSLADDNAIMAEVVEGDNASAGINPFEDLVE